jgi:hypothetical protein
LIDSTTTITRLAATKPAITARMLRTTFPIPLLPLARILGENEAPSRA